MPKFIAILFFIILLPASGLAAEIHEPAAFPSLISAIRVKGPLNFCGEKLDLSDSEIQERLEKELLLFMWNRAQIILWIKRTSRYMPYIEKMLRKNNMPKDLKYVSIVESSLLPHAGSSKGAVGYWQFIRSTGLKYGLRIDKSIDERRNVFTSTQAALQYLKKLYGDFGKWTLAAAAYNMGEAGLRRRINEQNTRDYYHLYLPRETQRYVFRIIAVKMILANPEKYGFNLTKQDHYNPIKFDRVRLDLTDTVPLQLIAEASNTYFKTIKDMNPEIRGKKMPRGSRTILIPKGSSRRFKARFQGLLSDYLSSVPKKNIRKPSEKKNKQRKIIYTVKRGDYLSKIASRYRVSVSQIRRWNNLRRNKSIWPGQRLLIRR